MAPFDFKAEIREVPDFPKPGINFYDLTTLFGNGAAFRAAVDALIEHYEATPIDLVAAIEARGFVLAAALAYEKRVGLLPIRKPGKLPWRTAAEDYALEYGTGRLEVHADGALPGQRVLIVDDLLATGGTARAAGNLVERLGAKVAGYGFLVELAFLKGREKLAGRDVFSLVQYV